MKKLFNILLVLVLALSLALPALAEAAEAPAPQIVDAKAVSYTHLDVYKRQKMC